MEYSGVFWTSRLLQIDHLNLQAVDRIGKGYGLVLIWVVCVC